MAEINDDEMFSMSYKDARDKYAVGVGNNKYFMSESDFNKGKERINKKNAEKQATSNKKEEPKKEQSLVAKQFGNPNSKSYDDVLRENGNDPAKMADWMNNNPEYKAGNKTKKGMEGFGYIQGADGKWVPKPKAETPTTETKTTTPTTETSGTSTNGKSSTNVTTDDSITELEKLMAENEALRKKIEGLQNPDGSIKEEDANRFKEEYMQRGLEMGAVTLDKDGNYVFTNTNKKGWEDWATMLSVGASVIGLAMGVPIMPINFRKITNKDEKDAKIREFQKQYNDILAGNAAKVEDVKSSAEAGKLAKANEDDINAYSKYKEDVGAYEAKSNIDTDSQMQLIDKQTQARLKELQQQQLNNEKLMAMENKYSQEMTILSDKLSTASAKELTAYSKTGWVVDYVKELKAQGLENKDVALAIAGLGGTTPTQMGLKNAESIVGMVKGTADTVLDHIPLLGKKK